MTVEDLLKPRYKVIAPYPRSPYEVGDLVEISPSGTSYMELVTQEMSQWNDEIQGVEHYSHLDNIKAFPNLFKKLNWCEGRSDNDLPEYFKREYRGQTLFYKKKITEVGNLIYEGLPNGAPNLMTYLGYGLPATEKEVEQYLNQNKEA